MMVSDNAISATTSKVRIISGGGYLTDENGFPVDNLVNLPKCVENSLVVKANIKTASGHNKNTSSSSYTMESLKAQIQL